MHYLIVSFTHKNTEIALRERLAFNSELEKESFLKKTVDCMYINEAVVLSTCNRVEVIASVKDTSKARETILNNFCKKSSFYCDELVKIADIYEDENAIFHLFSVASSIDSLVVGETQIVGQLKDAYKFALERGYCSTKLSRAINYSFKCASAVRNETTLGSGSVSVASTAVAKAKQIFKNLSGIKAIVVGAGEMSELCARHLLKNSFKVVLVSRDIKKASILAESIGGDIEVAPYSQLNDILNSVPLLFTATSAPYPIIKKEMIEYCEFERFWFDIAIPRDIEEFDFDGVEVYSVDDLKEIVDENMAQRAKMAKQAYKIVKDMTSGYFKWLNTLGVEPLIKALFEKGNCIVEQKIEDALKKGFIENTQKENINKLCHSIISKYLFDVSKELRNLATVENSDMVFETIQNVFNVKVDQDIEETNYKCNNS
ncbi:glutamyl-tRNA reductase [Arcobacter sp. FWKO B]|uniref:glutamyl-tRNA reductase n=1 Tax=Arcobacter sp. FWKO B TaxID=2593672 RepID=UPI0018A5F224|nr:glutamyl-tRNA reductase [Arcobacter sp. FWKO B]QOG11952.1 glutamyl-tRNA reductase [Arcobacter sp. FWKO B]